MKVQITVKVEKASMNPSKPFIRVFERILDISSDVRVPYEQLIDSLKWLYGFDSIVTISNANI